jgi:large subunit ribosomal protein L28
MRCEVCFKAVMYGNNVSHSKRRTKTLFKANVHKQTLVLDGKPVKVKICTRCLRSQSRGPRLRRALV